MPKYCLERVLLQGAPIVHDERCNVLDLATQLCDGRLYTIGEYASPRDALASTHAATPDAVLCHVCGVPPGEYPKVEFDAARGLHGCRFRTVPIYRCEARAPQLAFGPIDGPLFDIGSGRYSGRH